MFLHYTIIPSLVGISEITLTSSADISDFPHIHQKGIKESIRGGDAFLKVLFLNLNSVIGNPILVSTSMAYLVTNITPIFRCSDVLQSL